MKEIELVRSGLLVDMPHKVIDYRILDVLEALYKLTDRIGEAFIRETGRLDGRITALEERFERSLPSFEDMKGIYKEKPALKTCGECAHPCWSAEIPTNGVCFWHPLATVEIRKALGKRNYPEPVRIDDDACPNFEAIQ